MPPTSKQDSLSPATGASQLPKRVPSSESLNAHPLLSPNSPSSLQAAQSSQDPTTTTPPRYVPYTPRHRPVSSATTSMTTHASMPVASHKHQEGGAANKLKIQNLKAAAQNIGLGSGTVGWVMLEKLVDGQSGGEWDEIWTILTTAKPTLLLPLEPFSGELITPEFIKDHLAFCNGPAPSFSPLVTLSGLRGSINDSVLTFRSTIPVSSKPFLNLFKPEFHTSALASLPPLPTPHPSGTNTPLPSFALPASIILPFPPRSSHSKPPLTPRSGTSSSTPPRPQGGSRITNSFASLFGRPPPPSSNSGALSTSPSQSPPHVEETQSPGTVDVAAFSLGRKIIKKSVGKELSKILKEEIREGLVGCPTWLVDRVLDFTGPLHPIPRTTRRIEIRKDPPRVRSENTRSPALSVLPPSTQLPLDPSSLADAFQSFYRSLEDDLRAAALGDPSSERKMVKTRVISQDNSSVTERESSEDGKVVEQQKKEETNSEAQIKEVLERVESIICTVFYDRTFRPITGDDVSHDDALANRIAALSLLDLDLEHLGVEIPSETARRGVDEVVKACGETLQELESPQHRSPKDKSAILVEAHRKVADGLSRLPQLRLKPDHDLEDHDQDQKTPRASSFAKQIAQEAMEETSSSSPTLSAKRQSNGDLEAAATKTALGDASAPTPQSGPGSTSEVAKSPSEDASGVISEPRVTEVLTIESVDFSSRSSPPPSPCSHPPSPAPRPSSTVSGDLLFPLLIFSVVKANPAHLVSHLLYTQRFRSRSVGGQESYCLVNLMAVVEFLENVDMSALGLGDSERVMSTADLTPISLAHGSIDQTNAPSSPLSSRLGKRVNQQVGELAELAGSANKVITGVVDSSFGVLRGFLTSNPDLTTPHEIQEAAPWNMRPGFGMLRLGSGFSIASVAASLPGAGRPKTSASGTGEEGQQLIEVSSLSGSIKGAEVEGEDDDISTSSVESSGESPDGDLADRGDAKSVRSFSSMMNRESRDRDRIDAKERMSLTDRLAGMSQLSRFGASPGEQQAVKPSPPPSRSASRPTSWLAQTTLAPQLSENIDNSSLSNTQVRIPPPNRRFLECAEQDIRVGEVGELLREYRRMVQALYTAGAFEDHV